MHDWTQFLQSPNNVRRHFKNGPPVLAGLQLLRVVLSVSGVRAVLAFPSIPLGATDKWRRRGYTSIDIFISVGDAQIELLDSSALLMPQQTVSAELSADRLMLAIPDGSILIANGILNAEFIPDLELRDALRWRDEQGTDLEPQLFSVPPI